MRRHLAAATGIVVLSNCFCLAQQPITGRLEQQQPIGPALVGVSPQFSPPILSVPPVTPELWVYSQEQRRHDDPAQAVRRKAEVKADQRMARVAAVKWFGLSNSRPHTWGSPVASTYYAHLPVWGFDNYYGITFAVPTTSVGRLETVEPLR